MDFDTSPTLLSQKISLEWEDDVRAMWVRNKRNITDSLKLTHGKSNFGAKLRNFIDLGPAPFSIVSYYNLLLRQVRSAFVHCDYYPSLVGACALGERILNHLVLDLRENYRGAYGYKEVYRKGS